MARFALKLIALAIPLALPSGAEAKGWGPKANIVRSDGTVIGKVRVRVLPGGLMVHLEAKGLPPGDLGMHVHAVGRCDGPDFASAGPHWNPTGKQHGRLNPMGQHDGDLSNLWVMADGSTRMDLIPPADGHWSSPFDADGASLVIHAQRDDERTEPSGNSGARIACAVLAGPKS
jgi:Cu-Zn family superoxide dismutase